MKTISTKMKLLSMALLGLGGMALASSAAAQCPTAPDAWSGQVVGGGTTLTINTPGMDSTNCQLDIDAGTGFLGVKGLVYDESPQDEARYRARVYLDLSGVISGISLGDQAVLLNSIAASSPAGSSTNEVTINLVGTFGTPELRIVVADANQPSGSQTINVPITGSVADEYRIEFDLSQGTGSNNFRYWFTAASATSSNGSPTGQISVDNSGWSGVTRTNMGIISLTNSFKNNVTGSIGFDQFDSRRQTFIGQ